MKTINNGGFSILEVVVATVVGTLIMVGMSVLVNNIIGINDRTSDTVFINSFIEDKVEQLRSETFNALVDGTYDILSEVPPAVSKVTTATYEVSAPSDVALAWTPSLKQIDFTLAYDDSGVTRNFEYRTYIGELGVGQY